MAVISNALVLVDKFSNVWDNFINKAERANKAVEKQEQQAEIAHRFWQQYLGDLESSYDGVLGKMDRMYRTYVKFSEVFGKDSAYAIEAEGQLNDMLESTGMTMDELLEKIGLAGEKSEEAGAKAEKSIERVHKKTSKLSRTLTRLGVMFFGLRKIVAAFRNAIARIPDEVMGPFNKLKSFFSDTLARSMTSFFKGLNPAIEKMNALLESPAGQNFVKGLQVVFEALGKIAGLALDMVTDLFTQIGTGLESMGIDIEDLAGFIGGVIGTIYVTVHNIIAAIYNAIMNLVWDIKKITSGDLKAFFYGLIKTIADFVLDVCNIVAKALDWLFDSSISDTLMGWKATVDAWAAEQGGWDATEGPAQMEMIEYSDYVDKFSAEGRKFGQRLQNLSGETLNDIKASSAQTAGNTKAIKDALTDEDFKMLIDVATQKFVSNVNLTAQTPVITINGANTGNSAADRRALANDIKYILMEQLASGSTSSEYAYAGA